MAIGAMRWILVASLAAVGVVAVSLFFFAHPSGDDFCNAADVRDFGMWEALVSYYRQWGGRWSSQVLAVGFPALFEIGRWYPLGLLSVFATLPLALRFVLPRVLASEGEPRLGWTLTFVFLALYWSGMPHPGQSVYWLEGAWTYALELSLGLLLVGGLLRLPSEGPGGRRALVCGGFALAGLVVAAFHELFALILLALLAAGAAVTLRWRDPRRAAWVAAAVGALLGLGTILLSPGNAARQAVHTPEGPSLLAAMGSGVAMWIRVLDMPSAYAIGHHSPLGWVLDPRLLAATVLFVTLEPFRAWRPRWLERDPVLWKAGIPLLALALLSGSFLAGGWARGTTLPLRALNALYLVFLLGWFLTVFVHTRNHGTSAEPGRPLRTLQLLCFGVLSLGLLFSGNFKIGVRDLARGRAMAFDRSMEARYEAARAARARGDAVLVVESVRPWPSSYFGNDVDAISPPLQACVARYLGVGVVEVIDRPTPPP